MMQRIVSTFLFCLMFFQSVTLFAQGNGFGNFGQAMGERRQGRSVLQNSPQGNFFNRGPQQQNNLPRDLGMGMLNAPAMASTYELHILGQVANPGTYRLPPSTHLDEAINAAGSVTAKGSLRSVELQRSNKKVTFDLLKYKNNGMLSQNPFLLDNDVIFVPYAQKSVTIYGPVKNADTFELTESEKNVWDLVALAGGYTAGASLDADAKVIRFENEKKQVMSVPNRESELKLFDLQHGDIVIIPHILTKDRKFDYGVSQLPADNVFYPSYNDNIFVIGAVSLPGAYPFNPVYAVDDFVKMAGPNRIARLNSLHVLTADGKRVRGRALNGYHLSPGDTVVVPEKSWTADNVLKWYGAITGSIITGFTIRELAK